jgi:hypothetical protein
VLLNRNVKDTSSTEFLLELFDSRSNLLDSINNGLGDSVRSIDIVAFLRLSNVKSVENSLSFLGILGFLSKSMIE